MKKTVMTGLLSAIIFSASVVIPTRALASDWPFTQGDYWEVTGIHIKDGGGLTYAKFVASEWRADQEFAKSKGWIKGYTVLSNVHPRKGESDLYLVIISEHLASGAEEEKRADEYMAWKKKSTAQLAKESGNRLEIREIQDNELMQELKFK